MGVTFSPDPQHLLAGAGTAAQQTARPRQVADTVNGGYDDLIPATGASVGTPGTFTPAGAQTPANRAALTGITATPTTIWPVGTYVTTADGLDSYWSGSAWVAGHAPVLEVRKPSK
jgi:hypothetical protein